MFEYESKVKKENQKGVVQKKETSSEKSITSDNILQERTNNTGIPNEIKDSAEKMSGYSLDDVRVNYNSDKPAQLQALAYTQGNQVHIGPGQEKHLKHEIGHVIQQKQGRVRPTAFINNAPVNEDESLEKEADKMLFKMAKLNGQPVQKCSIIQMQRQRIGPIDVINLENLEAMYRSIEEQMRERIDGEFVDIARMAEWREQYNKRIHALMEALGDRAAVETMDKERYSAEDRTIVENCFRNVMVTLVNMRNALNDSFENYSLIQKSKEFSAKAVIKPPEPESTEEAKEKEPAIDVEYKTQKLERFSQADNGILNKIKSIRKGSGTSQTQLIDGERVLHSHVRNDDAIAFRWDGDKLIIMAYGVKKDTAPKGSGGYKWDTKPK